MNRRRNVTFAAVALACTAALAACGTETGSGKVGSAAPVTGVRWVPKNVTVDGEEYTPPSKSGAYVEFNPGRTDDAGGRSGGSTGCNHLGADVEIEGDTIKVSDIAMTAMGCPDGLQQFEERFVEVFSGNLRAKVSEEGRTLTLSRDNGDSITLNSGSPP
ncbi:META domain-containing protein [Streptomyces sp. 7N604]|uniref:META domain-containing protein n=1 Tax=Streptomyces sp. 7N604 TaxID=3457415 RepID=UPI003FD60294